MAGRYLHAALVQACDEQAIDAAALQTLVDGLAKPSHRELATRLAGSPSWLDDVPGPHNIWTAFQIAYALLAIVLTRHTQGDPEDDA